MQIDFEGQIHEFPDDFTDEDISAALGGGGTSARSLEGTPIAGISRQMGAMETIAQMGTGAIGQAVGGAEALVRAPFQGVDKAVEEMRKTQEALTYQPRTEKGQEYSEAVGNVFNKAIELGGDVAAKVTPTSWEAASRTLGEAGTETALNFLPLGAIGKGLKTAKGKLAPNKALGNLDRIIESEKAKVPETAAPEAQPFPEYKQQDLPLEPPVVDTAGRVNPYDLGGYISDHKAGMDVLLDSPQGDLFAQHLREQVKDLPEIRKAVEDFKNEALDLEGRMRAAMAILDSPKLFPLKVRKEARALLPELQKAHEANRNEYALGQDMLAQEKPRDAEGKPLYKTEPLAEEGVAPDQPVVFKVVPPKQRVPKKQKGAINASSLKEDFVKERDLGDGIKLKAYTEVSSDWASAPYPNLVIRVFKNGREVGGVNFAVDKPFGPATEAALKASDMPFINPKERGQGLASSMYAFASELGNDIRQDKTNTPSGQGMWNRMSREGLARGDVSEGVREGFIPAGRRVSDAFLRAKQKEAGIWNPFAKGEFKETKLSEQESGQEFVTQVERATKVLKDETDARQSVFTKSGADVDLIPEDVPVTPEFMDKVLAEPDMGGGKALVAGALAKSIMNNHNTAALSTYRWFANAEKRTERSNRDFVHPVAEALKPVVANKQHLETFKGIFDREAQMGREFTAEELSAAGIDPKVVNAYAGMRRMFDEALRRENEAREFAGLKPVSKMDAYQSARWSGPWRMSVLDKDGNIVWQVAESTRMEANKARKWLQNALGDDVKFGEIKYHESYGKRDQDLQAGYNDLKSLLGVDHPITKQIQELLDAQSAFSTENILGQEQHFKKKKGVQGFAGDRPWAKTDMKDWTLQQLQYAKNAFQWADQQQALRNVKEMLNDPRMLEKRNTVDFLTDYSNIQRGIGTTKVFNAAEHAVARAIGISPAHMNTLLGTSKSLLYITKLGFMNVPFSVAQMVQPILTAPYHQTLTARGFEHNPAKSSLEGLSNGMNFAKVHMLYKIGKDGAAGESLRAMPEVFRDAALYAEQNGVVDVNQFSDIRDLERPGTLVQVEKVAGWNIRFTEQLARSTAFMTFVSHLDQSGKFPKTREGRLEMFQTAEEATRFTMVDFSPSERALIFNKMGMTGHGLSTLRSFTINQLNQIVYYLSEMQRGNPMAALQFFGLYYLLGGMNGFLGLDDVDTLYNGLKSIVPSDYLAELPKELQDFSPKKAVMEMPDFISMGPISALTGINLYSRFDSSNLLPLENSWGESFGQLFPFIKDTIQQIGGLKDVMFGDKKEKLAGGYAITPTQLRGAYENYVPGMTTPEGVVGKTTNPAQGDYKRTEREQTIRNFGFRSTEEARTKEIGYRTDQIAKDMSERRNKIAGRFKDALLFGSPEDLNRYVKTYTKLGGDPETLFQSAGIDAAFVRKNTTRLQQLEMAAQTLPAIRDLIRYKNSLEANR